MSQYKIIGGNSLSGEIKIQGSKNEALQIICASLLTDEEVIIYNIPDILDVKNLYKILELAGADINFEDNTLKIKCKDISSEFFVSDEWMMAAGKLRGSLMLLGSALSRFGKVKVPIFGGDKIGKRPIDTHIDGFLKLGYSFKDGILYCDENVFKNTNTSTIILEEPSVTGTANILLAASMSKRLTVIYNAACEPYIEQLCRMLNRMGVLIAGHSTNRLTLIGESKSKLIGVTHTILPDFIEVASFISLAAITNSELIIKGISVRDESNLIDPTVDNIGQTLVPFKKLGIKFELVERKEGDGLVFTDIKMGDNSNYTVTSYSSGEVLHIYDAPWPNISPDILSVLLVAATQAKGSVLIHQKMFESRLYFVDKLIGMGAQIIQCDPHRAIVLGLNRKKELTGARLDSPDIRAGMALLIAAISAKGESIINNAEQIERGYENIIERLKLVGVQIEKAN